MRSDTINYLPTIYENVEWSGKYTTSTLLCVLCRREVGTCTSEHTCSSRGKKNNEKLIISNRQPSLKRLKKLGSV